MRREFLMCLAAILLMAGMTNAVVWNSAANPDPNTRQLWHVAENWTTATLPDVQGTATFNVANQPECLVTGIQTVPTKFAMGDGGSATNGTWLKIKNGGNLTLGPTNGWNAVGYNRPATLTVEKGGKVTSQARVMVGRAGVAAGMPSNLIVDGGTFEITTGSLQMSESTGWGQLFVDKGGLVDLKTSNITNSGNKMLIDVRYGKIIANGNRVANYDTWKNSVPAQLVAYGGKGTLVYDYNVTNAGKTTLWAISPMQPAPENGSVVAVPIGLTAPVDLSWKNMDPNKPGDPVYVDVWFGTDPNKLNPLTYTKVVSAQNQTTVQVNAPAVGGITQYYWQVDSYIYGSPTGTPIAGEVFEFSSNDDTPPMVVIDTPDMVTWANQPVQLNATVTDAGTSPVTITWSSDPSGAVFSPNANVEDPIVTVNPATFPTTYVLTCSVKDGFNPTVTNTDTVQVVVYADACAAARRTGAPEIPNSDVDGDCDTDLDDLYLLASDWITDYTILVPTEIP